MDQQGEHNIAHLETQIKELRDQLADVSQDGSWDELLIILHRPGWTTPAEYLFVQGLVETMREQVQVFAAFKQVLISGSRAVGTP